MCYSLSTCIEVERLKNGIYQSHFGIATTLFLSPCPCSNRSAAMSMSFCPSITFQQQRAKTDNQTANVSLTKPFILHPYEISSTRLARAPEMI